MTYEGPLRALPLWHLKVLWLHPLWNIVGIKTKTILEMGLVAKTESCLQDISKLEVINLQWSALDSVNHQKG